ncbi:hypothetical protein CRC_03338 [Cylindrospermopsis raciborskii CS-505]|nr:hypothetical protein CRC_03338 [Cylindrospermopsis raciborskii CS-505]
MGTGDCEALPTEIAKYSLRAIALSDYPSIPSQGKILNVLRGAHLGTFPGILLKGKT